MGWVGAPDGKLRVGKILGLVRNYRAHAAESGTEPPVEPVYFLKPATALLPSGGRLVIPRETGVLEAEAELAFVMSTKTKSVRAAQADASILGYCAFLDITARELQRRAMAEGLPWTLAKGMDGFAPISALRPAEEVGDPHDLEIRLSVNGEVQQRGSTAEMVHRIPDIVAAISARLTLERGDVIATGTPAGVPRVVSGDRLDLRIPRVGRLQVTVEEEDPASSSHRSISRRSRQSKQ